MQTLVKKNKELYLAVLRISLVSEYEECIDIEKKDGVNIILQLYQSNLKGRWYDQMSLNLFQFIDEFFPSNDLEMLQPPINEEEIGENQEFQLNYRFQKLFKFNKFIYKRGFDIKQKIHLQRQLQGKIYIENCKVNLIQTSMYKSKLRLEKQHSTNLYSNISQDNIVENSHSDFQTTLTGIKDTHNNDDNLSRNSSQNNSNIIALLSQKEDLSYLLNPKGRTFQTDELMIKDLLEENDIREMQQIILQKRYVHKPDSIYYKVLQIKPGEPFIVQSLKEITQKKDSDGMDSLSKKQVNFKNLIRESNRSSISLISRILKVSAKLKQNVLRVERNVNQTSIDQNNEHISRVNERTIVTQGGIEVLEYYNTAKKINYGKIRLMYQVRDRASGYIQCIRIQFKRNKSFSIYGEEELTAVIKLDNHLNNYGFEQVIVRGQENIEKLINIIQYSQETQIPIYKLNLLHKNIGFFSRLYFSSYIEHNKDSHLNKFLQKYNEKDEALYDLLKNAKSLLKEPSFLQLFLTRIKLTLISNFLSSHKHEQNFLLNTYFNSQKVSQYCNIKDVGKTIIQTVVYATNPMFTSDRSVFICLHLFSKKMRNTYSKLIFTIEDIQHLISKEFTPEICLQKEKIIKMVYLLSEKIVYFNSKQFPIYKLPLSNLNKNIKKCKYDLVNSFDPTPEPLALTKSILTNKTLLTPVLRSQKVIYICVKKILDQFTIITVRRFDILDYHSIEIYIPKSGRKWSTNIYQSDMWRFTGNFMESLFPFIYWEYQNVVEIIRSFKRIKYLDFTKKYENDMIVNPQKYIDKINFLQQDHNSKFYTSSKYISTTKFKYEKYYEQYTTHHLAPANNIISKKINIQQNNMEEKMDKQHHKSIISLQNIGSNINIPIYNRGSQEKKTSYFNKDQPISSEQNSKNLMRSNDKRQMSILKNSKSIGITNTYGTEEDIIQDTKNDSNQSRDQQRMPKGRHQLQKQLTFNEFLKEKNYVTSINNTQKSSKEILEEDASKDPYYSSYVFSQQRKVSFDQFSYMTKPNQFLKIFEKSQLEATDVLELKVILIFQNPYPLSNQYFKKKIWEKIINKMEVRVNEQGKLLIVIDTFKGLLKEILATFVIHLRSEDNVQIQISLEKQPQKTKSKMLLYLHSPTVEDNYSKGGSRKRKFRFMYGSQQDSNSSSDSDYESQDRKHQSKKLNSSDSSSDSSSQSSYDGSPKINNKEDENDKSMQYQQRTSDPIDEESENYFKQVKRKYEMEFLEKEMLGQSTSLYLEEAIKWDVFIRINFYEKLQTENEKLNMNLLLIQYFNENKNHLSQFTERFRSTNKKSAPRRMINKPPTATRERAQSNNTFPAQSSGPQNRSSIFEKLSNRQSSFKNQKQAPQNKTTMMLQKAAKSVMINSPLLLGLSDSEKEKELQEFDDQCNNLDGENNSHYYPENYCFVFSDFVAMANMIKNRVRENYLPSSVYEDEEYYQEQQKKQGKAQQHFDNVISANRVKRNTLAIVLADKSPQNQQQQKGKRSFLAPNTYQSDKVPQEQLQKYKNKAESSRNITEAKSDDNKNSNPSFSSISQKLKGSLQSKMNKKLGTNTNQDDKKKNTNNVSFTSNESQDSVRRGMAGSPSMGRLSGFNSRLKSILLAQPSYFSNIEEAVKFEPKVKINCEISIQRLIDPNQKHFIVMYRGVFTKKPLQMIAIYYKTSKRKFYAEIWNIKTQKKVKQKIKFKQICYQIPFIKQLLQLKQYSEIGRRIFLNFKNALMISTYYLINQ